jgi:hypothetical protein
MKNYLKFSKKKIALLSFCFINSIILLIITITWINHSYFLTDDEEFMIKNTTIIKNIVFHAQEKPSPDSFLFINIAWEKQLIDEKSKAGQIIGKRPITDRTRIAKFLEYVNKNPEHKFIVLDVWFKDSSTYKSDSILQDQLAKTRNILVPYHKNDSDDLQKDTTIFQVPIALSDYEKDDMDNNFIKFRLVQGNNFKTTPLVLYEKLHKKNFITDGFWYKMNEHLSLNSFILDLRISAYDLEERDLAKDAVGTNYNKIQMADLLDLHLPVGDSLPEEALNTLNEEFKANMVKEMIKNKIVVIGDFEDSDIHETIYGPTPGPLILLNVYIALTEGDNLISYTFILFLFAGYFIVSYKCFTHVDLLDKYIVGKIFRKSNFKDFIMSFMSYLIYFILLSIISYFLFNIHLTILLLAFYMEALERILIWLEKRKSKEMAINATQESFVA